MEELAFNQYSRSLVQDSVIGGLTAFRRRPFACEAAAPQERPQHHADLNVEPGVRILADPAPDPIPYTMELDRAHIEGSKGPESVNRRRARRRDS